jgi:hypothetical protein
MMKVICVSDQCAAPAALWHDGQITVAGEKPVKGFFVPSREAIASSDGPHERRHRNARTPPAARLAPHKA